MIQIICDAQMKEVAQMEETQVHLEIEKETQTQMYIETEIEM